MTTPFVLTINLAADSNCTYTIDKTSILMAFIVIVFLAAMGGLFSKSAEQRKSALVGATIFFGAVGLGTVILQAFSC